MVPSYGHGVFMVLKAISHLNEKGVLAKSCKHEISTKTLIRALEIMELTRHIDDRMVTLQRQGTITFAMSSYGEEGCVVASAAALEPEDWIFPQYREDGAIFWRGYTPQQYIDHMFSNDRDPNKGRQMPNHFGLRELNVVTVSSPLATQIPHAAGCAYSMKLQNEKAVSLVYFGEGSTSEGDFHVGMNFAAVRKAPCIFFCRNNQYAISTPADQQFASDGIAPKGEGYGMKTLRVDGNDFFAVHEAVQKARKHCLAGKGPVLIEAMTYRMGAHSTSDDPTGYRENAEVEAWKARCPIARLRLYLEKKKLWDAKKDKALKERIKAEVDAAIAEAKKRPLPPIRSMVEDVYFEVPLALEEQFVEVQRLYPEEVRS